MTTTEAIRFCRLEIELSALDGTNGFTINGINRGYFSGSSVSSTGDVNSSVRQTASPRARNSRQSDLIRRRTKP